MVEYTDTLDKTFHALAHPIRREMLAHLTHKRFTVLEMAQLFDLSLNGVSKHLKVLEQAGLIQREIQGRTHYCSLETERLREVAEWLAYYQRFGNSGWMLWKAFWKPNTTKKRSRPKEIPCLMLKGILGMY